MQNTSKSFKNLKVNYLFPKFVIFSKIGVLNYEAKIFLDRLKRTFNIGNEISINRNVLDNDILSNIKLSIEDCLEKTFRMIYDPVCNVNLYITNSWVNYNMQGMHHHSHTHSNSFLSGVYYVQAKKEKDKIIFYNQEYSMIKLPANNWNQFNSNSWFYPVESGDLIIFPSSIMHGVDNVETDDRISIGFNTFLKGDIGDDSVSFDMKLKVTNLS
jgi:hypothetical protein